MTLITIFIIACIILYYMFSIAIVTLLDLHIDRFNLFTILRCIISPIMVPTILAIIIVNIHASNK